ncbi:hypothetical protein [Roseibium sp.]|uniref:hypothetical protein n=1 Tax=Roseibium sp. TaxID=1936156 RepID=UPI003B51CDBD
MSRKIVDPAAAILPGFSDAVAFDEAEGFGDYLLAAAGLLPPFKGISALKKAAGQLVEAGGRKFLTASNGTIDFGYLRKGIAKTDGSPLPHKPIRVEEGKEGKEGFGADHLAPERHERARELGYRDAIHMMEDVSRNYDTIVEMTNGRLLLVKQNGSNRYAVVELQEGPDAFYGMTTTFPEQRGNVGKSKRIYLNREIDRKGGKVIWSKD